MSSTESIDGQKGTLPFLIEGHGVNFAPTYVPNRVQVSKERNLVRHANFCGLEDVFEIHGKNREIHVSGNLLHSEIEALEGVLDHNQTADLVVPGWEGEIRVVQGEYDGPIGWDPKARDFLWTYSLDLVSTGHDEANHLRNFGGVVDDGR